MPTRVRLKVLTPEQVALAEKYNKHVLVRVVPGKENDKDKQYCVLEIKEDFWHEVEEV